MFLILILKGFIIGIAFIIPGVSGGTLAIYLGVYQSLIYAINHLFSEFKKSVLFLLPIGIGLILSIVSLAKLLGWLMDLNSVITLAFFIGLLLGGIPSLYQNIKGKTFGIGDYMSFIVAFLVVMLLLIGKLTNLAPTIDYFDINISTYLLLFVLGFLSAATMIIPGVSGSALLITLGVYTAIVTNVVGNILDLSQLSYHLNVIIPFGLGAVAGILIVSLLIEKAFKHAPIKTYMAILGFIVASAIVIVFEMRDFTSAASFTDQIPLYRATSQFFKSNILSILIGFVSIASGFYASTKLGKLDQWLTKKQGKSTEEDRSS